MKKFLKQNHTNYERTFLLFEELLKGFLERKKKSYLRVYLASYWSLLITSAAFISKTLEFFGSIFTSGFSFPYRTLGKGFLRKLSFATNQIYQSSYPLSVTQLRIFSFLLQRWLPIFQVGNSSGKFTFHNRRAEEKGCLI